MRLLVVFLLITSTYSKRSKMLEGVKNTDSFLVEELISRGAVDKSKRYQPVNFGHIYREGHNPNGSDPIDFLELDSIYVKDSEHIRKLIKSGYKNIIPIIKEKPKGYASPKDEVYFGEKEKEKDSKDKDDPLWHDFVEHHRRNINISPEINKMPNLKDLIVKREKYGRNPPMPSPTYGKEPKDKYFDRTSFDLAGSRRQTQETVNWTTCAEFRRKADFHPKDVVNIDWVPFYVWSENKMKASSTVHRFTYPTKKLVKEYKNNFLPYINRTIDWEQPKLVLNEMVQMLLIAGDRRGLFTAIPHIDLPQHKPADAIIPTFQIRMKIVDPYLALMICDFHYAVIMAVSGNEPKDYAEIVAEAATSKFKGTGTPVMRDLEQEKEAAELEREYQSKRERDKFVYIE